MTTYKIPEIHFLWDEVIEKGQIMAEKAYKNAIKHVFIGSWLDRFFLFYGKAGFI